jgi:hypothetical protein
MGDPLIRLAFCIKFGRQSHRAVVRPNK